MRHTASPMPPGRMTRIFFRGGSGRGRGAVRRRANSAPHVLSKYLSNLIFTGSYPAANGSFVFVQQQPLHDLDHLHEGMVDVWLYLAGKFHLAVDSKNSRPCIISGNDIGDEILLRRFSLCCKLYTNSPHSNMLSSEFPIFRLRRFEPGPLRTASNEIPLTPFPTVKHHHLHLWTLF
jgi:hypothetical protein